MFSKNIIDKSIRCSFHYFTIMSFDLNIVITNINIRVFANSFFMRNDGFFNFGFGTNLNNFRFSGFDDFTITIHFSKFTIIYNNLLTTINLVIRNISCFNRLFDNLSGFNFSSMPLRIKSIENTTNFFFCINEFLTVVIVNIILAIFGPTRGTIGLRNRFNPV